MIPPEIIKKIKKVHINSRRLVNTLMAGHYKSVFRGTGIEFEEVREYTPGDEVKSIDWKVSARLGRPFIKRYREERELIVMLLIDMSASGRFGTTDNIKQDSTAEIASILAFNAIRNNDKVGAIFFTDRVEKYLPPQKGSSYVWRVIKELYTFTPSQRGTDIGKAVSYLGSVCRKRTVTFLISDFMTDMRAGDLPVSLKTASKKHEFISILVSDPGEFILPESGLVFAEDLETNTRIILDASDRSTRQNYEKLKKEEYQQILNTLISMDIDCIEIKTDGDAADALIRYFRLREKRKR